jgi:hypothetical protein
MFIQPPHGQGLELMLVDFNAPASGAGYWQPGNLNDAIRVLQLNEPEAFRYSVV